MTIDEYKTRLSEICSEMEEEHGVMDYVHVERVESAVLYSDDKVDVQYVVAIKF